MYSCLLAVERVIKRYIFNSVNQEYLALFFQVLISPNYFNDIYILLTLVCQEALHKIAKILSD
jgi:hypothetical protein